MGAVKEKIYELAELVYQIMDAGATDQEVDEYVESQVSPEEYEFYHAHKDIIFDMLPYIGESKDEISMPRLNEDSFDEQEFLEDDEDDEDPYNDDDLADYEWEIGSALTSTLEKRGIDYDEDNLGDVLRDKMEFILQCMKDKWYPLDVAEELINDDEFMAEITPEDDFDEDEMRKDMYDPQDDVPGRNLVTGDMDESYIMLRLDEGCNCGGRRPRPLLPTVRRPGVRRPINTPRIPSWIRGTKKLHERYVEVSDPVKDMGIGIDPKRIAKKFMDKMHGNNDRIAQVYFGSSQFEGYADVLYGFFRNIQTRNMRTQDAFDYSCENENFDGSREDAVEDRTLIADVIKKHFHLDVNPKDKRLMREYISDEIEMPSIKKLPSRNKQFPDNKLNKLK